MATLRRIVTALLAIIVLAASGLLAFAMLRGNPEDLPWTPLDLGRPIGLFTGRKLASLTDEPAMCRTLLDRAGIHYTALPPVSAENGRCGYADGVRFTPGGARRITFSPANVGVSCPVAAALAMWEWDVLQPAARRKFGAEVTRIDHFGSYSCRRIYGREQGTWSEHATADAIDIAGFRLSDGTRITVARDWNGPGEKAAFLHEVRDGACGVFATVLSPDYNAAHHDHLHLDQASRGATGWRACR
jgi:hypothetical protein